MTVSPTDSRRLVVLTGDDPEHHYVTNRLCACLPITAIVVDTRAHEPSLRRAFRGGWRGGFARIGLFIFRRLVRDHAARDQALRSVLGSDLTRGFSQEHLVTRVEGVNSEAARTAIAAAAPDALVVFGTTIVGADTLVLANDCAFNLHTGVSPRYRGTDSTFWPVVNSESEWIGATVHECTAAVDGGQIFSVARALWEPTDGLHGLFARAVVRGAELYIDVLGRYLRDEDLKGRGQDLSEGREYRGYMRTLGPELRARLSLRLRRLRRTPPHADAGSTDGVSTAQQYG